MNAADAIRHVAVNAAKLTGAQWLRQGRTRRKSAGR